MTRDKLTSRLNNLWTSEHFIFLQKCFLTYKESYQGSFSNVAIKSNKIIIDNIEYTENDIKQILVDYIIDDKDTQYSCFADVVYMFFTDFVDDKYNIVMQIKRLQDD